MTEGPLLDFIIENTPENYSRSYGSLVEHFLDEFPHLDEHSAKKYINEALALRRIFRDSCGECLTRSLE